MKGGHNMERQESLHGFTYGHEERVRPEGRAMTWGMNKVPMASQMAMGNMSGPKAGRGVPEETGWAEPGRDHHGEPHE